MALRRGPNRTRRRERARRARRNPTHSIKPQVARNIIIVHQRAAATLGGIALARHGARLVAHQARLALHVRAETPTLGGVFQADDVVGGGRDGSAARAGGRDTEFERHRAVGGDDLEHGSARRGFGVAAGVVEAHCGGGGVGAGGAGGGGC
jgi:hypothetical protein